MPLPPHTAHPRALSPKDLRPTQLTVGCAEVLYKRQQWRHLDKPAQAQFLSRNPLPAVLGPKGKCYLIDHHHLGLALLKEKVDRVPVDIAADLSGLEKQEFWTVMEHRQWVHPYNARGRRQPCKSLPKRLTALADDPYRSLAAAVRMSHGFQKVALPFAEFLWADFFRRRIANAVLRDDPGAALAAALRIVHDPAACHLPGWSAEPFANA